MHSASPYRGSDGDDGRNFTIERRSDPDGATRLILRGELDLAGQGDLRDALLAEQRAGAGVVVVLDQLDYLDSAGIGELLDGRRRATARGRRFSVTPGVGNVRRVLWISGVLGQLCGPPDGAADREANGESAG
jgi:anti-anti-sigma factor